MPFLFIIISICSSPVSGLHMLSHASVCLHHVVSHYFNVLSFNWQGKTLFSTPFFSYFSVFIVPTQESCWKFQVKSPGGLSGNEWSQSCGLIQLWNELPLSPLSPQVGKEFSEDNYQWYKPQRNI